MARPVREFVITYLVIATIFLVFSAVIALITRLPFEYVTMLLFLWGGFAYVLASTLAWTGFANLYRYSPTLFIGSRSYRRRVMHGDLWKEGRDDDALLLGLAFGAALMAIGAALWNPVFVVLDALGLAAATVFLRSRRVRVALRS